MADETEQSTAEDRFGRRVRVERERLAWTQSDLARELRDVGLSLHPSAIAKIELRDVERPRSIRLEEAQAIARVFNLSVDEMYENDQIRVQRLFHQSRILAESVLDLALDYETHIGELESYLSGVAEDEQEKTKQTLLYRRQVRVSEGLDADVIGLLLGSLRHPSRDPSALRRYLVQEVRGEQNPEDAAETIDEGQA